MALVGKRSRKAGKNIIDYLSDERRGFGSKAICDVDMLAFCALSHLEYENVPEFADLLPLRFSSLVSLPQTRRLSEDDYLGPFAGQVLDLCARSPRFKDVAVCVFDARLDMDEIVQFGASAYLLRTPEPILVVAYRGTGTQLTGWHEDFNLAVMKEIPAQRLAVKFLDEVAERVPGIRIMVTGHSKGGALAEYAALFCAPQTQVRIEKSVVFDAPGLFGLGSEICREFKAYDENLQATYDAAPFPLTRYVFPSFVGLMMEPRPLETMLYCKGILGKFPHDMAAVVVKNGEFELRVPSADELLRATALNRWVEQLTLDERQLVIDSVFSEFYSHGRQLEFTKMADLKTWAWFFSMHYARSDQEKRKTLGRIMGLAAREFGRK